MSAICSCSWSGFSLGLLGQLLLQHVLQTGHHLRGRGWGRYSSCAGGQQGGRVYECWEQQKIIPTIMTTGQERNNVPSPSFPSYLLGNYH